MNSRHFHRYYLFSCVGVLLASYYPLSMGVRVITDMITKGTVMQKDYPKYIIPYTPICLAILVGVLLMPLCITLFKRFALLGGSMVALGAFFAFETLFEQKVVVTTAETVTKLEDWQMYMCYMPPQGWGETVTTYKTQTAVDILMGNYNPAFKLHFYLISVVLILCMLNCLYGFGQMIKTGKKMRLKALILQSVSSLVFLGLCILACFTAFWRDGSLWVSPISAILMAIFFILLGVTVGIFLGSFLLGKKEFLSVWVPANVSLLMTFLMYIGEMILLHGHLYRLGDGFLFRPIPYIILAPVDLIIIFCSGGVTMVVMQLLNGKAFGKKSIIMGILTGGIIGFCFFFNAWILQGDNGTYFAKTPVETIEEKYDKEEFVITKEHWKTKEGLWVSDGYTYRYRLEITGRNNAAVKNTTYIVLSNREDITFEQTWKASGLSSLMSDYFEPDDAVIVGHKLFE